MNFTLTEAGKIMILDSAMAPVSINDLRIEVDGQKVRLVWVADGVDYSECTCELPGGGSITLQGLNFQVNPITGLTLV
jgi:hypothetical protein